MIVKFSSSATFLSLFLFYFTVVCMYFCSWYATTAQLPLPLSVECGIRALQHFRKIINFKLDMFFLAHNTAAADTYEIKCAMCLLCAKRWFGKRTYGKL